jgi:hypothetical protein
MGGGASLAETPNVAEVHRLRYKGASFPVDPQKYTQLLANVQIFFRGREFEVTIADATAVRPVAAHASAPEEAPSSKKTMMLVFAGVAVVALAVAFFALRG